MPFSVPALPYEYNALEPVIDDQTMHLHHDKHHATYVNNLNTALEGTDFAEIDLEELMTRLEDIPEDKRTAVRNNGGGHYNHSLFWQMMRPPIDDQNEPTGSLMDTIIADFESFDNFKQQFTDAASKRFGSGWAWLVLDGGKLSVTSTPNQDNPLMESATVKILLGLDVWEHAYYLKYQNKRPEYIENWWKVVNWDYATEIFGG